MATERSVRSRKRERPSDPNEEPAISASAAGHELLLRCWRHIKEKNESMDREAAPYFAGAEAPNMLEEPLLWRRDGGAVAVNDRDGLNSEDDSDSEDEPLSMRPRKLIAPAAPTARRTLAEDAGSESDEEDYFSDESESAQRKELARLAASARARQRLPPLEPHGEAPEHYR